MRLVRSATWILLVAVGLAACDLNPPEPQSQPPPHFIASPEPSVTPSPTLLAVWVLWPLGVNVHQAPATTAAVAGAADQSQELDVDSSRAVDGKTWLQVHSSDGALKGWVLDDPGLLIHRHIDLQIDTDQSWSMAFPTGWNVDPSSGPTGATTLTGDGQTMTIDVEVPTPKFTAPGAFVKDQEVELYGKTTVLSTYRLADGSYEFVLRRAWDAQRYFTLTYKEPAAANPDPSLCLQLITGIKVD
jgi:hypothetical protein